MNRFQILNNSPQYRMQYVGEQNIVDVSSIKQLNSRFRSGSFSVKYVMTGTEHYTVSGKHYPVGAGRYLLTNACSAGEIVIDSQQPVQGLCIEVAPGLVSEVLAVNQDYSNPYPDTDFHNFLTGAGFFESDYAVGTTNLGRFIQSAIPLFHCAGPADDLLLSQFFYGVAENMLCDQKEVFKYLGAFDNVKYSTRKDLLGRLLKGKEYMDDNYCEQLTITAIAQQATMSEYYFLRLFKQVFRCPPHKYLVHRRLSRASVLLQQDQFSVAEVAYKCGFSDIHSFSKAFKKHMGHNPSEEKGK